MMYPSLDKFEEELRRLSHHYFPTASIEHRDKRLNKLSLRIRLKADRFIDVYYNNQTHRLDFTVIENGQRIFGFDNAGGWHYHPVEAPDSHKPFPKPTLAEIFSRTKEAIGP